MRKLCAIALLLVWPGYVAASALPGILPDAQLRGSATFRYLGLPVYDARLFTKSGAALDWSQNFALELTYRRAVRQADLVDSTLKEFARLGAPLPLGTELQRCFSDVKKGDRYLAVTQGPDRVAFWRNGAQTCILSYQGIKQRFMEIFVGDNTRSPGFTRNLRRD